jgi:hypothetical protein
VANPFSLTGRLYFDGAGNVFAAPTQQSAATSAAGTYTVNMDCTVTVTLSDPFGTNKTTTKLQGIVLGGGTELDLVTPPATTSTSSSSTGTGTTTGTTTTTGNTWFLNPSSSQAAAGTTLQPGVLVRMTKLLFTSGCTTSNLMGPYGLVATGVQVQTTATGTSGTGTGTGSGGTGSGGTGSGGTGSGGTGSGGTGSGGTGSGGTGSGGTGSGGSGTGGGSAGGTITTQDLAGGTGTETADAVTGTGTTATVTGIQPFVLLGRAHFDGNGNIVADQTSPVSPLPMLDFTGTYTVNADCSGTMTLIAQNTSTSTTGTGTGTGAGIGTGTGTTGTTTTTSPITVNFVLGQPSITVTPGSPTVNWNTLHPALSISVSNANQTAFGYGMAQ